MGEFVMTNQYDLDPATIVVEVLPEPIKSTADSDSFLVAPELLHEQGVRAREHLVSVDPSTVAGTCIDERKRVGLLSGEAKTEPRPSVSGGPDVYGLAIAELTGVFSDDDNTNGDERLHRVKRVINAADIKSGGHQKCAANADFNKWIRFMSDNAVGIKAYAQQELGDRYDESAMDEVLGHATSVAESGRYTDWSEDDLVNELGNEADAAIEKLADVPHEGLSLVRNEIEGTTVDQTALYDDSVIGKGSFVNDEWYADKIEHAIVAGPNASRNAVVAAHAREAILAAVAAVVPNKLLYQIRLKNAA